MHRGLTSTAKHVIEFLSQTEAKKCKSDEINPEHVMLAILREGSGTACRILRALNIDTDAMRISLTKRITAKRSGFAIGHLNYSERGKRIIEDALEEAKLMGNEYVGTEHLLLACVHELGNVATKYLFKNNISISILQEMILKIQSQGVEKSRIIINRERDRVRSSSTRQFPSIGERKARLNGAVSDKRRTPILDEFCLNLTQEARKQKIDPVVGRAYELRRIVQILVRRNKNNPILIGDPGVGKTAIVEGLARLIATGEAPFPLVGKQILCLDLPAVVAGTKYRGEFEERLTRLMKEAQADRNVILFIDEIHTMIGAGGAEGAIDAANIFKPILARGDVQCIGATTTAEYKKHIELDSALERRFQSVLVGEPSIDEAIEILHGVKTHYEQYHHVRYNDEAIRASVLYSKRYISDRFLPDKAIDVIDEAGARHQVAHVAPPKIISDIQEQITKLNNEKVAYVNAQNYERAALLRDEINKLEDELITQKQKWKEDPKEAYEIVTKDILDVVSDIGRIPVQQLAENETERLILMEDTLNAQVIGQREAIRTVAATIRKSKVGLHAPHKPIGSFLLLGPTGVGKTLLAKELALFLFGSQSALIRVDMSDYMEKHTVSRLVGAPPGYVGFQEGGELTEKIRRKPYSIVLFDEIEKAHRDFFNILLQVLEEGELQDNSGRVVSFRNTVVIMTSNIGTDSHLVNGSVGFIDDEKSGGYEEIKERTLHQLKRQFRTEFLNRIDTTVVFRPLEIDSLNAICQLLLNETQQRLHDTGIELQVNTSARNFLTEFAYKENLGARPLRRLISAHIEEPFSHGILSGVYERGGVYCMRKKDNRLIIEEKKSTSPSSAQKQKSLN